jgi:hypothetical protein
MRIAFAAGLVCATLALVSCKQRDYARDSDVKSSSSRVNPLAFNAFEIWRDNKGNDILNYPQDWDVAQGSVAPDSIFYVDMDEFWTSKDLGSRFIGVPTPGPRVLFEKILEYPGIPNRRPLRLKFTSQFGKMTQAEARQYCKNEMKGRLPTARELFDFCATGIPGVQYGSYTPRNYPSSARCYSAEGLWSASVNTKSRDLGWFFYGHGGYLNGDYSRIAQHGVRCVVDESLEPGTIE